MYVPYLFCPVKIRPMAPSSGCLMSGTVMPLKGVHTEDDRGTLCISSQAGCAVGCRFCSTGHQGFSRNLTTSEIIAQPGLQSTSYVKNSIQPSALSPMW